MTTGCPPSGSAGTEAARELLSRGVDRDAMEECAVSALAEGRSKLKCENLQRTSSFKARGAPACRSRGCRTRSTRTASWRPRRTSHARAWRSRQMLGIRRRSSCPDAPIPKAARGTPR